MKKFEWLRAKVWGADIHSLLQDFEEVSDEQFRTLRMRSIPFQSSSTDLPSVVHLTLRSSLLLLINSWMNAPRCR